MNQRQRVGTAVIASVTLLVGVGIGATGAHANKPTQYDVYAGTKTTPALVAQIANDALENQRYADWCGGVVKVDGTDISVEGCDK